MNQKEETFLLASIAALECGNTASWAAIQDINIPHLSQEDVHAISLRWIAVILRNELLQSDSGPTWSILDMDAKQLSVLLSLTSANIAAIEQTDYLGSDIEPPHLVIDPVLGITEAYYPSIIWACDPSRIALEAEKAMSFVLAHPAAYDPVSQLDILCGIADYLKFVLDWKELAITDTSLAHKDKDGDPHWWNFETLIESGSGGCNMVSAILSLLCKALRIPVIVGLSSIVVHDPGGDIITGEFTFRALLNSGSYTMLDCADSIFGVPFKYARAEHSLILFDTYLDYTKELNLLPNLAFSVQIKRYRAFFKKWLKDTNLSDAAFCDSLYQHFYLDYGWEYSYYGILPPYGDSGLMHKLLNMPLIPGQNDMPELVIDDPTLAALVVYVFASFCNAAAGATLAELIEWDIAGLEAAKASGDVGAIEYYEKLSSGDMAAKEVFGCDGGVCETVVGSSVLERCEA